MLSLLSDFLRHPPVNDNIDPLIYKLIDIMIAIEIFFLKVYIFIVLLNCYPKDCVVGVYIYSFTLFMLSGIYLSTWYFCWWMEYQEYYSWAVFLFLILPPSFYYHFNEEGAIFSKPVNVMFDRINFAYKSPILIAYIYINIQMYCGSSFYTAYSPFNILLVWQHHEELSAIYAPFLVLFINCFTCVYRIILIWKFLLYYTHFFFFFFLLKVLYLICFNSLQYLVAVLSALLTIFFDSFLLFNSFEFIWVHSIFISMMYNLLNFLFLFFLACVFSCVFACVFAFFFPCFFMHLVVCMTVVSCLSFGYYVIGFLWIIGRIIYLTYFI